VLNILNNDAYVEQLVVADNILLGCYLIWLLFADYLMCVKKIYFAVVVCCLINYNQFKRRYNRCPGP
jgi:hypothetical protein